MSKAHGSSMVHGPWPLKSQPRILNQDKSKRPEALYVSLVPGAAFLCPLFVVFQSRAPWTQEPTSHSSGADWGAGRLKSGLRQLPVNLRAPSGSTKTNSLTWKRSASWYLVGTATYWLSHALLCAAQTLRAVASSAGGATRV